MTDFEAYQEYIQRKHNAFCKAVIRYAACDKILQLRRKWERQISLDYLKDENDQAVQTMQTAIDNLQLVENSAGSTNADTTNTAAAAQTAAFAGMLAVSAAGIFLFRRKRQMK